MSPEATSQPLISVVIRTKDRPKALAEALDSVMRQDYRPIELVVVNDGGADVKEQLDQSAELQGLVYLQHEVSKGRSAAANAGLLAAHGEFVILLDDDDLFLPQHLSRLQAAIDAEHRLAYAGVDCGYPAEDGEWQHAYQYDKPFDAVLLLVENYIPIHAALFDRRLALQHCRFDESMDTYEDWDFWLQLAQHTEFRHVPGVSALYRIDQNSGFGLNGDPQRVQAGLQALFAKWQPRWTSQQLLALVDYAKHHSMYQELRKVMQQNHEKMQAMQRSWEETYAELERYRQRYTQQRQEIEELQQQHAEKCQRLQDAQENCTRLYHQTQQQQQLLTQRQQTIDSMFHSHSWRLTRFLRGLVRVLDYRTRALSLWREQGVSALRKDIREHAFWREDPP